MQYLMISLFYFRYSRLEKYSGCFILLLLYSSIGFSQIIDNSSICKKKAIESAQLANQSYLYSYDMYFSSSCSVNNPNIDTALIYIQQAIASVDSAIYLASDSDIVAKKYANISRNFAIDVYRGLVAYKVTPSVYERKTLLKKIIANSEHATADAYHASFYFKGKLPLKNPKKDSLVTLVQPTPVKQITKLDIDQTLFTLLKEELKEKKESNLTEILQLKEEFLNSDDKAKQAKLSTQLKTLEVKTNDFDKKINDAEQKLTSINTLINERDKLNTPLSSVKKEETVFAKSIAKVTDEWNKQVKIDSEMPEYLVYQVQLGVYKNAVLPEIFKGLTPIYGTTTDKGVCYSTGLFEKLVDAKEAKQYVLNMGLKDAFIVAYRNKKKITLAEALKLEKK